LVTPGQPGATSVSPACDNRRTRVTPAARIDVGRVEADAL
jgi:hypothetical protein